MASNQFGTTTPIDREPCSDLVVIARVRIPDESAYKGEYGFDWIDVNVEDKKDILKIQGVDFSNVEYFYKPPANSNDLGNIESVAGNEDTVKEEIVEHYGILSRVGGCKYVDQPYILIKKDQDAIELALKFEITGELNGTEKIYIQGKDAFDLEIVGGKKDIETKKTEIDFSGADLTLKIKCIENIQLEQLFEIWLEREGEAKTKIGGFKMMENTPLTLRFRVIALVASGSDAAVKAKELFQKFKDKDIDKFLNKNSLNQAGYNIEIDNQFMFDNLETADLDDYFYAFDKEDWTAKKYFGNIHKEKYDVEDDDPTKCKPGSWDYEKGECAKISVPTEVIVHNQRDLGGEFPNKYSEMDGITIAEYKNKLQTKGKSYDGGIIILSEFESSGDSTAYSRRIPLNHYAVFVYKNGIETPSNYAHEIGHMLGLSHTFFKAEEQDSYKTARENILGNGKPETIMKDGESIPNPECILPIEVEIQRSRSSETNFIYNRTQMTGKKSTLITAITNSNTYFRTQKSEYTAKKTNIETRYSGRPGTTPIVGTTQTKDEYLSICRKGISKYTSYIDENRNTLQKLNAISSDKIQVHKYQMYLRGSNASSVLNETKQYYYSVIRQMHSNYLMFKQGSTKNMMDYNNTTVVYLHNQIKTMRDDLENY